MSSSKEINVLQIPKYNGSKDSIPIKKWLALYEKISNKSKNDCLYQYLEGEALKWYLTEIFEEDISWKEAKEAMTQRFENTTVDPFRKFIHFRLGNKQTIQEYFEQKQKLGQQAGLAKHHIISGLTDGLPPKYELYLIGKIENFPDWLTAASKIENCIQREYKIVKYKEERRIASSKYLQTSYRNDRENGRQRRGVEFCTKENKPRKALKNETEDLYSGNEFSDSRIN